MLNYLLVEPLCSTATCQIKYKGKHFSSLHKEACLSFPHFFIYLSIIETFLHPFTKELQHLVCNLSPKTRLTTKLSRSNCQLSIIFRTFAADYRKNRDVAQLVAHYVRDVGVACSSHVIPTRKAHRNIVAMGFLICQLSVMCCTVTSSWRKRLALSLNLVGDSVVKYWQVPPWVSRWFISGCRCR